MTSEWADVYIEHLAGAAAAKKKKALTTAQERGLLNINEEETRAALRIPDEVVDSIIG